MVVQVGNSVHRRSFLELSLQIIHWGLKNGEIFGPISSRGLSAPHVVVQWQSSSTLHNLYWKDQAGLVGLGRPEHDYVASRRRRSTSQNK